MKKKPPIPTLNFNSENNRKLNMVKSAGNLGGGSIANSNQISKADLSQSFQVSLGIDFTFNTIKNVKKVNWKEDAPWFREISDGLSWICYC